VGYYAERRADTPSFQVTLLLEHIALLCAKSNNQGAPVFFEKPNKSPIRGSSLR
jgi:hypothetical protein